MRCPEARSALLNSRHRWDAVGGQRAHGEVDEVSFQVASHRRHHALLCMHLHSWVHAAALYMIGLARFKRLRKFQPKRRPARAAASGPSRPHGSAVGDSSSWVRVPRAYQALWRPTCDASEKWSYQASCSRRPSANEVVLSTSLQGTFHRVLARASRSAADLCTIRNYLEVCRSIACSQASVKQSRCLSDEPGRMMRLLCL